MIHAMIPMAVCLLTAAPEASTLQEFLANAEQANIDRRISAQAVRRATNETTQAWTGLLPYLTLTGGWTHNQYAAELNQGASLQPILSLLPAGVVPQERIDELLNQPPTVIIPKNQLDAAIRVDVPLIDPQRWLRISGAEVLGDGAKVRESLSIDLIRRNVVVTYYSYVAALAVRDSARKTLAVAEAQLKLVTARVGVGSGTELELLRSKAEVQRALQTIADAEQLVLTSARSLQSLTFLTPTSRIALPEDNSAPEPPVGDLESKIESLPAVRAAQLDVKAQSRALLASRLAWAPTIGFQFTERFTNATGFQGQNALYNLGINFVWRLDVPTFAGMSAASASYEITKLQEEKTRLQTKDQIYSDWQRLNAALTKVKAAAAQTEAAQRASQVARDRFAVGATTQLELIQADRDMFQAEVGQIQAKTELALARASLRISSGRPIN
jgi:outer membrane protein TolC